MNGSVYRPQQQTDVVATHGASPSVQSAPPTIPVCTIGNLPAVHEKFVIIEKMLQSQVCVTIFTHLLTYSLTHSAGVLLGTISRE